MLTQYEMIINTFDLLITMQKLHEINVHKNSIINIMN